MALILAGDKVLASHMPLYAPPHNYQIVYEVTTNDTHLKIIKKALNESLKKQIQITILPTKFERDIHMVVEKHGADYRTKLDDSKLVSGHKPSVDVMFHSVAKSVGPNTIGLIMTGMGRDGADGLLAIRNNGGFTIAQDEASCVVFGMPKEAIKLGGASIVANIEDMPACVFDYLKQNQSGTRL
jgi:chemotaxis response regulator CheB